MKRYIASLLLLFIYIGVGWGQSSERKFLLRGYVLDRERQPLSGVSVQEEGGKGSTHTNAKGYYQLLLSRASDSLVVVFGRSGYRQSRRTLTKLTDTMHLTLTLVELEESLGAVEVVGRRVQPSRGEEVRMDKVYLGTSPAGGVEALVGTMQGVSQRNELSGKYNVRGGSFDENLIYINGVEIYRPLLQRSAEQEGLSPINPDMVGALFFSSGAFSVAYADKASSVLDIRYREPEQNQGHLQLGLLEGRAYLSTHLGKWRQMTGLRYKRNTSLLSKLDTKAEYNPLYWDAQTLMSYTINPKLQLSLLGNISSTDYLFIPQTRQTSFGTLGNPQKLKVYFDGQEHDSFRTTLFALALNYRPSQRTQFDLRLSGFDSHERESFDISSEYFLNDLSSSRAEAYATPLFKGISREREHARNQLSYQIFSLSAQLSRLFGIHRLRVGTDLRREAVVDKTSEWSYRDSLGFTLPMLTDRLPSWRQIHGAQELHTHRLALYLEDSFGVSLTSLGRLNFNLGLRSSYWSGNGEWLISPRLQTGFTPVSNKDIYYHISYGLYYQAPFYKELKQNFRDAEGNQFYLLNRKDLKSQGAFSLSAGVNYAFRLMNRPFRFTVEGYYKRLFHINPYTIENVRLQYLGRNVGQGYVVGAEAKLYGEFVEGVDSWLTISLMQGEQEILGRRIPLPNLSSYIVSLYYQDYFPHFKPLKLSLRGNLSSGVAVMLPDRSFERRAFTSPPYRRVDIGVIYRITDRADGSPQRWWRSSWIKSIDLGFDLLNLFDMTNTNSYYWITNNNGERLAVPNYLTPRATNFFLVFRF